MPLQADRGTDHYRRQPRGIVEDFGVYVVVGAIFWPAVEGHHHILGEHRQRDIDQLLLLLISGGQVPQQAYPERQDVNLPRLRVSCMLFIEQMHLSKGAWSEFLCLMHVIKKKVMG